MIRDRILGILRYLQCSDLILLAFKYFLFPDLGLSLVPWCYSRFLHRRFLLRLWHIHSTEITHVLLIYLFRFLP